MHIQAQLNPVIPSRRTRAPVFVVGCPRSGTTYLYHALLSAGGFAIYRAESQVFHLLEPRFGDLNSPANRKQLLEAWFQTRLFTATGLDRGAVEEKVMCECHNGGDFLRLVMDQMATQQGVKRWAECTPDHVLYLKRIKETIQDALIVHMIRDGRDVAVSLEKQGWPQQLPWDRMKRRMAAGVFWEWMVHKGREAGKDLGADYTEVRYEHLVDNPRSVLNDLSSFVGQDLDYDEIQRVAIGSVSRPNTSFHEEGAAQFAPLGRWKKLYSQEEMRNFENLVGDSLARLSYERSTPKQSTGLGWTIFRAQYKAFFEGKFRIKVQTPLGKFLVTRDLSNM
ncbi:MAG TPA: sulfotransferase [Candidatus Sulfotelmatobacter sp.]|nr:sulfotransferase [Candidatus Sulfotelmatobacter sp.]